MDFGGKKAHFEHMHEMYWQTYRALQQLEQTLEHARTDMQRACTHVYEKDWSSRGRSVWECKHCGKLR